MYVLLGITLFFLWFIWDNYFPSKRLPPGPPRLPLIGNALTLILQRSKPPFIIFQGLNQKYGSICYVRTGTRQVLLIDDFDVSKQLLSSDIWVNRPFHPRIAERSFGRPLGIIFVSGEGWKEMRRFSMRTLRDFGYGRQTSMQALLDDEVKALLDKVEEDGGNGGVLSVKHLFTMPVLNILWGMVSTVRTAEDDVKLRKLIILVDNLAKANPIGGNILTIFPWLRHIFPVWTGDAFAKKCHRELQQYFRDVLERRRKEGTYAEDKRDFIDMFIQEIDKHKKAGKGGFEDVSNHYTDEQFISTIIDLFEAGSETSSNTMEFAVYYTIKTPGIQERVQGEIDKVVGRSRYPTMLDKAEMPFTEATLLEVQRMANVLPMTVRCPTEDTTLKGYHVPKFTTGIVNIYSIHMDESFWGDPFNFRPDRFLDADSKIIPEKASRVIPFGAGTRICLGKQMALTTMFVYYTALLQHFNLEEAGPGAGKPLPMKFKEYVDVGFTLSPKPYKVKVVKRP